MKQIISGHINEFTNKNEKLFLDRIKICKVCPLFKKSLGGMLCNSDLWINSNNETSTTKKEGFTRGCGCRLSAKLRLEKARCIINKW